MTKEGSKPTEGAKPRDEVDGRSRRWEAHRARRQDEFLEAAVAAVEEEGPGVGIRRIAERIGVPRSAVYRHFRDRADLDELIRKRALDSLMAELAPTLEPDGTVVEAIRRSVDAYLGWIEEHPRLHAFLGHDALSPAGDSPTVAGTKAEIAHRTGKLFQSVLRSVGRDTGLALSLAFGLVGFVDATVNNWLADKGDKPSSTELAEFLARSIWSVLDGNLRALGTELDPHRPMSELLGD
ncbi:TetR/AcrR family transcriptional regulator [Streptomyces sp. NA04227]|uniref:TetR/AcrR family transcriptional regulator n=1 Tax=Streptomyces sp. NA04227 TaxID=2742136 RepID=UPI0015920C54|nr:TetR/AcrR family transcriptional regulator [Streptomyces sp. NA04227]QKW06332.1 TetR/AcrR family transcriptional regulator [Streptomyces sp. NA04227]